VTDSPGSTPGPGPGSGPAGWTDPAGSPELSEVVVEDPSPEARKAAEEEAEHERRFGLPGKPFSRKAPFMFGLLAGLGLLAAYAVGNVLMAISSVIIQVVVALFIAAGLHPMVAFLERHRFRRAWAVLTVILLVLCALTLFVVALVPVISDQVAAISANVPDWLDRLQNNQQIQDLNEEYQVLDKVRDFVAGGSFVSSLFGGVLGVGLAVLGFLVNAFVIIILTLYFLGSYEKTKGALFRLAPASRRERVSKLGDRILEGIGSYVSGAFIVALCAGLTSLAFLFIVGMGEYAVALAFVVMLTDVIPMIGATIGAAIVCAIAFATDLQTGLIAVVFYLAYQQFENYVIYPRVMSRSVDIPSVITVIAALVGASLLGVIGALLAIPTAAAILMLTREVFVKAQDQR